MTHQSGLDHRRNAIREAQVDRRLVERSAVVLERVAFGGAHWYWCRSVEDLSVIEQRISRGSVVSFYFDRRIEEFQLGSDMRSRRELADKLAVHFSEQSSEFREAFVGELEPDGVSICVQYITSASEFDALVASLPDGHTFVGTFPDRSNDGINAITLTVPDDDGVVRHYPH